MNETLFMNSNDTTEVVLDVETIPQPLIDLRAELESDDFMPKIVGQAPAKAQIKQRVKSYLRTRGYLAPILLVAPRGYGKTVFTRGMGKRLLLSTHDQPKPFVEINGSTLKSVGAFIEVVSSYLAGPDGGGAEVTVFIDEVHSCDKKVRDFLLSFISPNGEGMCRVIHGGQEFEINYRQLTLLMATTDAQKLTEAFKSRCNVIALNTYTKAEMAEVLNQYLDRSAKSYGLPRPTITEAVEDDLVSVCRRTPRFAVKVADDLVQFCANEEQEAVDKKLFRKFVKAFDIHRYGLNRNELRVLQALHDGGAMTLNALAARVSIERSMIQRDCENILHENGLIVIDGTRAITAKGREALAGW